MMRSTTTLAVFLALACIALLPSAASAATCSIRGQERAFGATYVTKLSASGTSCAGAKRVVRGYHSCRRANGGASGRCTSSVRGYRCSERRGSASPVQYDATVTCRKGSARVTHSYSQNT